MRSHAFALTQQMRDAGISAETDLQGRSLKSQFKQADRMGAIYVLIVGPDEVERGEILVRDMRTKEQAAVILPEAVAHVSGLLA